MPPDAQLRQDEYRQKYYTALFASDELDDELLKEPIGEVFAIYLEVQSGLGEVVSICGHGISADSLASILSATLWMFKHSPVGER